MSDLIQTGFDYAALPVDAALNARAAAERIKLRLKRTVEDIIEIGRELTAVKAELPHGEFLPWIAAEFEMSQQTANNFTSVYERFGNSKLPIISNLRPTILYALSAPSTPESVVDKAVAKAESGENVTVADVKDWKAELEAERQRREAAEKVLLEEQQRCCEFGAESNERRLKIRELETHIVGLERRIDGYNAQPNPQPIFVEKPVIPADYETAKATAAKLKEDLAAMRKKQDELVAAQVKAKLREREKELADLDRQAKDAELRLQSLNKQIDSYSSVERMTRLQRDQIEKCRSMLAELAANMEGFDRLENDPKTDQLWAALADMLRNGADAIDFFTGVHHPGLSLVA